ncbi:MAG: DUF2934 domain-containing protein [Chitinispirillaceae bacterium]|nr:DUF2934 domain-containing protein [Chitinispirillaceae bacterium]
MDAASIENSVKQRAFDLFVKRGGIHGSDQEDWFQAEKDIRDQGGKQKSNKRPGAKS